MKILKKIVLTLLVVLVLSAVGGYIYFDRKFTPDENYLAIENESGFIPLTWLGKEKNVLLLPIYFEGDTTSYYLQFDTGSPYTVFYSESIKNIFQISVNEKIAKTSFYIGKTKVTSDKFKIYNQGNKKDDLSLKIIGTIGADILEDRKTLINFKENYIALNLAKTPSQFQTKLFDFKFKKRKIIFKGLLKDKEESFLFDSGTSAYELLTNKEVWTDLKLPNSKIDIEKSQSWDKVLTTYTTNCNQKIQFQNQEITLNKVTYVEGFSQVQYAMMKFSGVCGLLFRQFVNIVFSCEICTCQPKRNRALQRCNLRGISWPTKYNFQEHCFLRCFFLNNISEAHALKKPYAASYSAGVLKFSASWGLSLL